MNALHFLHPGDVARAAAGDRLETLLGSCVSAILTDPRRTVATMCHIVHINPSPVYPTSGAESQVGGNLYRRVGWTVGHELPEVLAVTIPSTAPAASATAAYSARRPAR